MFLIIFLKLQEHSSTGQSAQALKPTLKGWFSPFEYSILKLPNSNSPQFGKLRFYF